jgi:hypothetical protein
MPVMQSFHWSTLLYGRSKRTATLLKVILMDSFTSNKGLLRDSNIEHPNDLTLPIIIGHPGEFKYSRLGVCHRRIGSGLVLVYVCDLSVTVHNLRNPRRGTKN